jgi:hypothetical protein
VIKVLVVTGHDHFHHRWRVAAARLRETLEESELFDVRRGTEWAATGRVARSEMASMRSGRRP